MRLGVPAHLQQLDHEAPHVGRAADEARRRERVYIVVRVRRILAILVAIGRGQVAPYVIREIRHIETAARHAQRLKDILVHVLGEWCAGDLLDHEPGERYAVVVVGDHFSRGYELRRQMLREVFAQRLPFLSSPRVLPEELFVEAARVCEQVEQRYGTGVRRRDLHLGHVAVHILIERYLTGFSQMKDRRRGERLAHGTDAEDRPLRIDGDPLLEVREAVAPRVEHLAVLDHQEHRAGDVRFAQRRLDDLVDEGPHLLSFERHPGRLIGKLGGRLREDRRCHHRRASDAAQCHGAHDDTS